MKKTEGKLCAIRTGRRVAEILAVPLTRLTNQCLVPDDVRSNANGLNGTSKYESGPGNCY